MAVRFADRMGKVEGSAIRELLKLTARPEVISFAGGMPAPELFPVEEMKIVSVAVLEEQGKVALQYTTTEGYLPLREKIAQRMNKTLNTNVKPDDILITSGSQQGLDFSGKTFLDKGDVVLCESPSYMGALNAMKAYEPEFIEIATDNDGMKMEELEKVLFDEVESVTFDLRRKNLYARAVAITYRNFLFKNYSHQMTMDNSTNSTADIYNQVLILLSRSWREEPIRNIGIRLSDLTDEKKEQMSIFDNMEKKEVSEVEKVMDEIINKFGRDSVKFASKTTKKIKN